MLLIVYIFLVIVIAAIASICAWLRIRAMRTRGIVQTLAMIVGQALPLGDGLRAAAGQERARTRRILLRMAALLDIGAPLSAALSGAYPPCPPTVLGAVQGAERGGTLSSVLRMLAADQRREARQPSPIAPAVPYLLLVPIFAPLVVTFVMVIVIPKFKEIFADYGLRLPSITVHLINAAAACERNWYLIVPAVLLGVLAYGLHLIIRQFIPRLPDRFQLLPALGDTLAWWLPGLRTMAEAKALAHELPLLQAAIRSGQDVPAAARQTACVGVNWHARRRLLHWAAAVEQGAAPAAAARQLRFPGAMTAALASAHSPQTLGAALEYLATYYSGLAMHWRRVLASVLMPCLIGLWGLCVAYIVVALLLPLVTMIHAVASTY
jgi:type II secretory pathway component PulF